MVRLRIGLVVEGCAASLDFFDDVGGVRLPYEGLRVVVPVTSLSRDRVLELGHVGEGTAA